MTSESENDISVRLTRDVIRGRAIKVDRRIWERTGWVNVDVDLLPLDVDASAATIRFRKADDDSDYQLGYSVGTHCHHSNK
jgi:hypothetical protein